MPAIGLPLYLQYTQCPKCLFAHITTKWHAAWRPGLYSNESPPGRCCSQAKRLHTLTDDQLEWKRQYYDANGIDLEPSLQELVSCEHMCRTCPNCGWCWAEAPLDSVLDG